MPADAMPHLVMLAEPASARAEAFRVLRARLQQAREPRPPRSFMVTSPTAVEQRHLVAANLALAFAESGTPVIAVDADLHRPQLHTLLSLPETPGLLQCLADGLDGGRALRSGPLPGLSVLPAGGTHAVPAQLVGAKGLETLLATLGAKEIVLIVVAPPVLPVADASLMAPKVDGVILLSAAYKTTRASLREAKARLDGVGATILGTVLDGVSDSSGGRY